MENLSDGRELEYLRLTRCICISMLLRRKCCLVVTVLCSWSGIVCDPFVFLIVNLVNHRFAIWATLLSRITTSIKRELATGRNITVSLALLHFFPTYEDEISSHRILCFGQKLVSYLDRRISSLFHTILSSWLFFTNFTSCLVNSLLDYVLHLVICW